MAVRYWSFTALYCGPDLLLVGVHICVSSRLLSSGVVMDIVQAHLTNRVFFFCRRSNSCCENDEGSFISLCAE